MVKFVEEIKRSKSFYSLIGLIGLVIISWQAASGILRVSSADRILL